MAAMTPLIAEDLLWMLHDDHTGEPLLARAVIDRVLAGAVLLELTSITPERPVPPVRVLDSGRRGRPVLVASGGASAESDAVLVDALCRIVGAAQDPGQLLDRFGRGLRTTLLDRLIAAGRIDCDRGRVLGVFARGTWPTIDIAGKQQLRTRLHRVLFDAQPADARSEALLTLLSLARATAIQCAGWEPDLVEHTARAQQHRYLCAAVVTAVERAVCRTQAGLYTGAV